MSIFPRSLNANFSVARSEELPLLTEYAYDIENNEFITEDGKPVLVTMNEALKIWIFKAIVTERAKYTAYTYQFGCEITGLIGEVINDDFKRSEIKRYITEALMVNPYIVSIESIDMELDGSKLTANVSVLSVYDDKVVSVSVEL